MKLGRRVKYSHLLIPNRPVRRRCERCGGEREFRLLTSCELTHFWYLFQWNFDEKNYRICAECGHAYLMGIREWRAIFPLHQPLASKQRRRLVFAVVWVPVLIYLTYWYWQKL